MRLYLEDILGSLGAIEDYTRGLSESEFMAGRQVQDAVMRRLEIIGEAARHVDQEFRQKHAGIEWRRIAGLRDVLIHAYFGVNPKRVWHVVEKDLPLLKKKMEDILKAETQKKP